MHSLENKKATVLRDGRVHHQAHVTTPGSEAIYAWSCACHPDDAHDHEALHATIAKRLEQRHVRLADLHALEGFTERVGLVRLTITDCNIQIHGPAKWVLHVSWLELAPHHEAPTRREYRQEMTTPSECVSPAKILDIVRVSATLYGHRVARALRAAGDFL